MFSSKSTTPLHSLFMHGHEKKIKKKVKFLLFNKSVIINLYSSASWIRKVIFATEQFISNDTVIDSLSIDQHAETIKNESLDVKESIYALNKLQSKYSVEDRFNAIRHICPDFGPKDKLRLKKFVDFLIAFGKCFECDVFDSISEIVLYAFAKIIYLSRELKKNKNIEKLKRVKKENKKKGFDKIAELLLSVPNIDINAKYDDGKI